MHYVLCSRSKYNACDITYSTCNSIAFFKVYLQYVCILYSIFTYLLYIIIVIKLYYFKVFPILHFSYRELYHVHIRFQESKIIEKKRQPKIMRTIMITILCMKVPPVNTDFYGYIKSYGVSRYKCNNER